MTTNFLPLIQLYESPDNDYEVDTAELTDFVSKSSQSLQDNFKTLTRTQKSQFESTIHEQIHYITERNYITVSFDDDAEIEDDSVRERVICDLVALDAFVKLCNAYAKVISRLDDTFMSVVECLYELLIAVGVAGSRGVAAQFHIAQLLETVWTRFGEQNSTSENAAASEIEEYLKATHRRHSITGNTRNLQNEHAWIKKIIPHMISYFLAKSLDADAQSVDIKKCYHLRECLSQIEYETLCAEIPDMDQVRLRDFVCQALLANQYLGSSQGQKFLIYCFSEIHPHLTSHMHAILKDQIFNAKPDLLQIYADFYFKAWKNSSGQIRITLEMECIQNLMESAMLCRDKKLFSNIRLVLRSAFLSEATKKLDHVDDMLLRLYEPIIFRNLCVANATVRRQAACLFVDVFPLRNPNADRSESEQMFIRQVSALKDIAADEVPAVRCVGVEGTCQILKAFWETFPADDRFALLKSILFKYAFDGASKAVRISVIKGLNTLLDNHQSHPIVKQFLCGDNRQFGKLIHDSSSAVRKEFLALLLHVKSIKSLSFLDMVAESDLVRRMCIESGELLDQIIQLLLPSYFAYKEKGSEQFWRFRKVVSMNSLAAKKFYEGAAKYVSAKDCCAFVRILNKVLNQCCVEAARDVSATQQGEDNEATEDQSTRTKRHRPQKKRKGNTTPEEDAPATTSEATRESIQTLARDLPFMETSIEIVSLLVEKIATVHKDSEDNTLDTLFDGDYLMNLRSHFKTNRIISAVWKICKFLPKEKIAHFSQSCLSSLESMCEEGMIRSDMFSILECMMQWKQTKLLMSLVEERLDVDRDATAVTSTSSSSKTTKRSTKKRRTSSKKLTPQQIHTQSFVALHFFNALIDNEHTRRELLKQNKKKETLVDRVYALLETQMTEHIPKCLESGERVDHIEEQHYIAAFHTFAKLSIHMDAAKIDTNTFRSASAAKKLEQINKLFSNKTPQALTRFLSICKEHIIPSIAEAGEKETLQDVEYATVGDKKSGKKRKKGADASTAESDASNRSTAPYLHLSVCVCKSLCIILADALATGMFRSSHSHLMDTISSVVFGLLRPAFKRILPFVFGDLMKVIHIMLSKDWDAQTVLGLFKETVLFTCSGEVNLFDAASSLSSQQIAHEEKQIKVRKQYLHKILHAFLAKDMAHHTVYYLFNACLKELSERDNEDLALFGTDSDLPPISNLVAELIAESPEALRMEFFKKIHVALNTSNFGGDMDEEESLMESFYALQMMSLFVNVHATKQLFGNKTTFAHDLLETLSETQQRLTEQMRGTTRAAQIADLIETISTEVKELMESSVQEESKADDTKRLTHEDAMQVEVEAT